MKPVDLHVHTNHSDGELSPRKVVELAIKRGLKAIAITDHNTISGIAEALEYSKGKSIKVVPGVELSCTEPEIEEVEVHVIGLFIEPKKIKISRGNSIKEVIESIKESGGISVLAHPAIYRKEMYSVIDKFILSGGEGLEIDYPYDKVYPIDKETSDRIKAKLKQIAKKNNLLVSGGSDFHGENARPSEIGEGGISEKELKYLTDRKYIKL